MLSRSYHYDNEWGITHYANNAVLLGSAARRRIRISRETKAPRVTRNGTKGTGMVPQVNTINGVVEEKRSKHLIVINVAEVSYEVSYDTCWSILWYLLKYLMKYCYYTVSTKVDCCTDSIVWEIILWSTVITRLALSCCTDSIVWEMEQRIVMLPKLVNWQFLIAAFDSQLRTVASETVD